MYFPLSRYRPIILLVIIPSWILFLFSLEICNRPGCWNAWEAFLSDFSFCWREKKTFAKKILIPVVLSWWLVIQLPLFLHLTPLIWEKEADAVTVTGYVDKIKKSPGLVFYKNPLPSGGVVRGDLVVVDDKRYYFITSGSISVGDKVELTYLPDSRYVVFCTNLSAGESQAQPPAENAQALNAVHALSSEAEMHAGAEKQTLQFLVGSYRRALILAIISFPVGLLCICAACWKLGTIPFLKRFFRDSGFRKGKMLAFVSKVLFPALILWGVLGQVPLLRYILPAVLEKDTAVTTGYVEEIQSGPGGVSYVYPLPSGARVHGNLVTIDGIEYYFITSGPIAEGDQLKITYLPVSRYVVECTILGGENEGERLGP